MKRLLYLAFLSISYCCSSQQIVDSRTREIVFRDVNLIPMDKEIIIPHQVVLIKDGIIMRMGDAKKSNGARMLSLLMARENFLCQAWPRCMLMCHLWMIW